MVYLDTTQNIDQNELVAIVETTSAVFNVDPHLVFAIVEVESGWDHLAIRYEPAFNYLFFPRTHAEKQRITQETEEVLQKCSWGPMQIMGAVARELGFKDSLLLLSDPKVSILYGVKKLDQLLHKYEEVKAVSAYNQGSPRMTGGLFNNQRYVDKVYSAIEKYRALK